MRITAGYLFLAINLVGCAGATRLPDRPSPVAVPGHDEIEVIKDRPLTARGEQTCLVRAGSLRCWGDHAPKASATGLRDIAAASSGGSSVCAISQNNLYCTGRKARHGSVLARIAGLSGIEGVASEEATTCAVSNHRVLCWETKVADARKLGDLGGPAQSLDVGTSSGCLVSRGQVHCWGDNDWGQLAAADNLPSSDVLRKVEGIENGATQVAVGEHHACATVRGELWCWGKNVAGQLGAPTVGKCESRDNFFPCSRVPLKVDSLGRDVTSVAAGRNHTCAVADGVVRCWGTNSYGQLGPGAGDSSDVPVKVPLKDSAVAVAAGDSHTCALTTRDEVYCWGRNSRGQLGNAAGENSQLPVLATQSGP